MEQQLQIPSALKRQFIPSNHKITDLDSILPWLEELLAEDISTLPALESWLIRKSEAETILFEEKAWRFIRMTCDTSDSLFHDAYSAFVSEIAPHLTGFAQKLRIKLSKSPAFKQLDPIKYEILIRQVENDLSLFSEENIPLVTHADQLAREFDKIASHLTIKVDGEEYTLQKAGILLEDRNHERRKHIWRQVSHARLEKADELDQLFENLVQTRHKIGKNAGFDSYADYKSLAMGRFDYGRKDCKTFHKAIEKVIMPLYERQMKERQQLLGVETLKPWDSFINVYGDKPLRPFSDTSDLIHRSATVLDKIRNGWGEKLLIMKEMGHLDLDNRLKKAPGGYNYTLPETGVPFIFMNAVGTQNDLVTMMHESGHALHSFATQHLLLSEFKNIPSEVAELAAMSMEFISMDLWDVFYDDPELLKRAQRDQIQRPVYLLPWIATVDEFQFWVYDNPTSGIAARREAFGEIFMRLHGKPFDWSEDHSAMLTAWHKQRHIFDLPFYYIEYGIAQLGAIAIWRNYRQDPEKALNQFWKGLSMGYTRPIPEVYKAAGIRFDFSEEYIHELADFVATELAALESRR